MGKVDNIKSVLMTILIMVLAMTTDFKCMVLALCKTYIPNTLGTFIFKYHEY